MNFNYSRPEPYGISPHTINRFLDFCERDIHSIHWFAVVKGMTILASGFYSPMKPDWKRQVHSISKSINSLAVGIAIGDGKLHFEDRMVDFFPEDVPVKHDSRIEKITVRDMLMMASSSAFTSKAFVTVPYSWKKCYMEKTPYDEPGKFFAYDTGASYMLSCMVKKATGKSSLELLRERVFPYIGVEKDNVNWLSDRDGNSTGGWGAYVKPIELLKIGRLILNYGCYEGRQLIPEWYMRQATQKQIENYYNPMLGWPYGYGYQFWRYAEDSFGCFGSFGQFIVCNEKKDLYVVTNGGCTGEEDKRLSRIITETIIAEAHDGPLPNDDKAYEALTNRLESLHLPFAAGCSQSSREKDYFEKTYIFPENNTHINELTFKRIDNSKIGIEMAFRGEKVYVEAGHQHWCTMEDKPLDTSEHMVHSFSYGWRTDGVLQLKQYLCNSSYNKTYDISFTKDGAVMEMVQNVTLYDDKPQHIKGVLK